MVFSFLFQLLPEKEEQQQQTAPLIHNVAVVASLATLRHNCCSLTKHIDQECD